MSSLSISLGTRRPRWWSRLTAGERVLLAALAVASLSVFLPSLVDAALTDRVFIGADGAFPADQLQYLAWATDAGRHGLIGDLFAFHLGAHVFLHPVWFVTGWLHVHVGFSYPLILVLWKFTALLILFVVLRAYARSVLSDNSHAVTGALLMSLFMVSPSYLTGDPSSLETFSLHWINGDEPTALAVAAMIVFLMQTDSLLSASEGTRTHRRQILVACVAGLVASWHIHGRE